VPAGDNRANYSGWVAVARRLESDVDALLAGARAGNKRAFDVLAEPYYRELHLHCYRMLGSFDDAEDAVQDALFRAWRGLGRFAGRSSFRSWLYAIATNACLDALTKRHARLTPPQRGPAADPNETPRDFVPEPIWLEPYPDVLLDELPDPEARYLRRETVALAFLAAIQLLPPRQRAVLLLRDVLGWTSQEVARLLQSSVASVNSALQRARTGLEAQRASPVFLAPRPPSAKEQELLKQYVRAFEQADVALLVRLLRRDVIMTMPPDPTWFQGRDAVGAFIARWVFPQRAPMRLLAAGANRQPGFALYALRTDGALQALAIHVLRLDRSEIGEISGFVGSAQFSWFGLPQLSFDK
jgi:RNA polymerase sigma-70 factor (ECF subfamily)